MNYIKQESEYALYSDISDLGKKIDNISNVNIVNSDVKLDNCSIYGYSFKYDGDVIEKK